MKKLCKDILIIGVGGTGLSASAFTTLAEKYPLVITASDSNNVAEIKISGVISDWNMSSSQEITARIDDFIDRGINDVDVYINSPGGDVFQAAEIINQIKRFSGLKRGFGGAIVASAAGAIAIELDSFEMAENGQFMYHKPSGRLSGNEDAIASGLKLLQNLTIQYKEAYAAKTGLTADVIEANWAKGDVWLSAKEAVAQKFITGVIPKTTITPDTKAMFEACGAPNIPRLSNNAKNKKTMDQKILALSLGLPEDASEETIKATIKANKEAAAEVAGLRAEKVAKETADSTAKVDALINGAITAKKVNATQGESLKTWAKTDFAGCESYINGLTALGKVSEKIIPGVEGTTKNFSAMSEEEKQIMATDEPEAFKALYFASLEKK